MCASKHSFLQIHISLDILLNSQDKLGDGPGGYSYEIFDIVLSLNLKVKHFVKTALLWYHKESKIRIREIFLLFTSPTRDYHLIFHHLRDKE